MLARGILASGRTGSVSSRPFPNSSGWWWLISSVFLIRISCHKTTHANGYCGAWPGWAVSISMHPLTGIVLKQEPGNQQSWVRWWNLGQVRKGSESFSSLRLRQEIGTGTHCIAQASMGRVCGSSGRTWGT